MKTIVLALLGVVMILMVALFGCSSKESSENTKNDITYVYNGSDTLKGENEVLKRLP